MRAKPLTALLALVATGLLLSTIERARTAQAPHGIQGGSASNAGLQSDAIGGRQGMQISPLIVAGGRSKLRADCDAAALLVRNFQGLPGKLQQHPSWSMPGDAGGPCATWSEPAFLCALASAKEGAREDVSDEQGLGAMLVGLALADSSWFRQGCALAALREHFGDDLRIWLSLLGSVNHVALAAWDFENVNLLFRSMPSLGDAKAGSIQGELLDACLCLAVYFSEAPDAYDDSLYESIAGKISTEAAVELSAQLIGLGELVAQEAEGGASFEFSGGRALRAGLRVLGFLVESRRISFSRGFAVVEHLDWESLSKFSNFGFQLQMLLAGGLLAESPEAYEQCVRLYDSGFYTASEFGGVLNCMYYDREPAFVQKTNRMIRSLMSRGGEATIDALGIMRSLREGMRPGVDVIRNELARQRNTGAYGELLSTLGHLLPGTESFGEILFDELRNAKDLAAQKAILDVARHCSNSECFPFLRKVSMDGRYPLELNRYAQGLLPMPITGYPVVKQQN